MTLQLNRKASWATGVLGISFDMLSMRVCTTRQWQTSSRLVQELNQCTILGLVAKVYCPTSKKVLQRKGSFLFLLCKPS